MESSNSQISLPTDTDFNFEIQHQMRDFMTPYELKTFDQPSQTAYIFLNRSLKSQKEMITQFVKNKSLLKEVSQMMLFFISFYKDIEAEVEGSREKSQLRNITKDILNKYSLSSLNVDIEQLNESNS